MPLIDLKTELKSLRYGADRPGGGSSGQPYITNDINDPKNNTGVIKASLVDTKRVTKYVLDNPLFLVKQVGLQLSNPRLEVPKNPFNIISGGLDNILAVGTNGLLQPTRIYNLGINTIAQVPVNAFGVHFNRHGILPIQNDNSKYEAVARANNNFLSKSNNNRLVGLTNKFQLGKQSGGILPLQNTTLGILGVVGGIFGVNIPNFTAPELVIDKYIGGPSSLYGIGQTLIKRNDITADGFKINEAISQSKIYSGKSRRTDNVSDVSVMGNFDYYLSSGLITKSKFSKEDFGNIETRLTLSDYEAKTNKITHNNQVVLLKDVIGDISKKLTKSSISSEPWGNELQKYIKGSIIENIAKASDVFTTPNNYNIYSKLTNKNLNKERLPSSNKNITYSNSYGDVINFKKKIWSSATREIRVGSGRQDKINLTPIFSGGKYDGDDKIKINKKTHNIRDLVKFRIQAVDTDAPDNGEWMVFRAYITDLSDGVDASWSDVKYAGRGDKFYIYDGFTRKMSVSFKVAALSEGEMEFIYQKLNFLMSNLMPDYGKGILMRGPLARMTIGNWVDSQLCVLNSVNLKVSNETPWEIAMDEPEGGTKQLILPHVVDVTLSFTPIGSESHGQNKLPQKGQNISHIAQNNTGDIKNLQYIK